MRIEIENLTFKCIIGILDFERVNEQRVVVNATIDYNYSEDNFIDYVKVADIIKENLKKSKFKLLEDALLDTKDKITNEFKNIDTLYLKITKPDILKDCTVSLSKNWKLNHSIPYPTSYIPNHQLS